MTTRMLHTFLFSLATFTLMGATLLWHRVRLGWLEEEVEERRMRALNT